jgi:hypothetical protein
LSYDSSASSSAPMGFSSDCERQLVPDAEAARQGAAAKVCWRKTSGETEEVRDLGMGKEKPLSAQHCSETSLLPLVLSGRAMALLDEVVLALGR